ncbi:MAG: hypothetical protein ACXVBW_04045 [Bdellovibrionota bacterium]
MKTWARSFLVISAMVGAGLVSSLAPRAHAMDLTVPFMLENAQVLPKGLRNPVIVEAVMPMTAKFDEYDHPQPLAAQMNKAVTFNDFVRHHPADVDPQQVAGNLPPGAKLTDSPGMSTGQVNVFTNVVAPTLAYGVTNWCTVAVIVPIITIKASADTGFIANQLGQDYINQAGKGSNSVLAARGAAQMNDAVNNGLRDMGYNPIPSSQTVTAVGDIQVLGKFLVAKREHDAFGVKSMLTIPSGVGPNPDNALDLPTGDARFAFGAGPIYDRTLFWDIGWNVFGTAAVLFPNQMVKRIPSPEDYPLSRDKESLTRTAGGLFAAGTSLTRAIHQIGMTFGAGYQFQYLTATHYVPGALDPSRYALLDQTQPFQTMHAGILTAGISTVEWFLHKKFPLPFMANVTYAHPIAGQNVTANDVFAGNLVLFF